MIDGVSFPLLLLLLVLFLVEMRNCGRDIPVGDWLARSLSRDWLFREGVEEGGERVCVLG